jgi:hypothetical protein
MIFVPEKDILLAVNKIVIKFFVYSSEKGKYYVDFKNGEGAVGQGDPEHKPDVTITMNEEVFLKIFNRKKNFILSDITILNLLKFNSKFVTRNFITAIILYHKIVCL